MQKLRKSDRRQFDEVCRKIREALHVADWRSFYYFKPKSEEDTDSAKLAAACCYYPRNKRICIYIYDTFWSYDAANQLHTLIHEHIHALLQPFHQLFRAYTNDMSADERYFLNQWQQQTDEQVTDHMEAVLYDLLEDRL